MGTLPLPRAALAACTRAAGASVRRVAPFTHPAPAPQRAVFIAHIAHIAPALAAGLPPVRQQRSGGARVAQLPQQTRDAARLRALPPQRLAPQLLNHAPQQVPLAAQGAAELSDRHRLGAQLVRLPRVREGDGGGQGV
jgi:hypothetical protein